MNWQLINNLVDQRDSTGSEMLSYKATDASQSTFSISTLVALQENAVSSYHTFILRIHSYLKTRMNVLVKRGCSIYDCKYNNVTIINKSCRLGSWQGRVPTVYTHRYTYINIRHQCICFLKTKVLYYIVIWLSKSFCNKSKTEKKASGTQEFYSNLNNTYNTNLWIRK